MYSGTNRLAARGFTLVEVMIATLVFSVGMMAVMTMEFSALRAYSASRDLSVATGVASRTVSIMKLEESNWAQRPVDWPSDLTIPPLYDPAQQAPIDIFLIGTMLNNPWEWSRATDTPLNERLIKDAELGRYCVYVRGDSDGDDDGVVVRAQIAVIYPTKSTSFTTTDCTQVQCGAGTRLIEDLLQPTGVDDLAAGDARIPELERCGWRAVYSGTMLHR